MTTGQNIALTNWTSVSKVTSLLFNMLSRFVIAFLPRSKRLLLSWLHSPSTVIFEPKKISLSQFFPIYLSWCNGSCAMILVFWQDEKGTTEDEMAGWHHWLCGRESEWTPRVGDGQGGLACCNSWGRKELDTTEWLNWTELVMLSTIL